MEALDVSLYADEEEQKRHASAIHSIASSKGVSAEVVKSLYERTLARIGRQAIIKDFLSIFVTRRVERVLKRKKGILNRLAGRRKEYGAR